MSMRRPLRGVLAVATIAVLCFVAGWMLPTSANSGVHARGAVAAPVFVHPGAMIGEAARRFDAGSAALAASVDLGGVDQSVDVTPSTPPKPIEVDIAQHFRRDLAAVVLENGVRTVFLADAGGGVRSVKEGGSYRGGWRVKAIGPDMVVIARRRDSRSVPIMGSSPPVASNATDPDARVGAPRSRLVLTRQDARAQRP